MAFDEAAARTQLLAGIDPEKTSTQSWGVDIWSQGWRDKQRKLKPGVLGSEGGAWWFRALTDPGRLTGEPGDISADPLRSIGARACLTAFLGEANQVLVHWPVEALAPAAFPLREAVGANEAINLLAEAIPAESLAPFIDWLGPIAPSIALRWLAEVDQAATIVALAHAGEVHLDGLHRLTETGSLTHADKLSTHVAVDDRAAWVLATRRPVTLDLLTASLDHVDDEMFAKLTTQVLSTREHSIWELLALRPLPAVVPQLLDKLDDPRRPWIYRYLTAGAAPLIDALIAAALGRGRRAHSALEALAHLDRTEVLLRVAQQEDEKRLKLLERLEPSRGDLPELPPSLEQPWMAAVRLQSPRKEPDWLDVEQLPDLVTRSQHRLPRDLQMGIVALLQEVRFDEDGKPDAHHAALSELLELLDPSVANIWWNTLFAMWWTHHRPDARWGIYAAAFLCDGQAIRDLGAKLHRHHVWFGGLATRVIATLGHSPTKWSVASLDDISRRSKNASHRELAARFLCSKAERAGQTLERFVDANLPDELDPMLLEVAGLRLERAMTEARGWTDFTWRELVGVAPFAEVARALIWRLEDEWGEVTLFRWDGSESVDVDEAPIDVGEAEITVAHSAEFTDTQREAWNQRFADYEIVQPFDQLERTRYRADSLSKDGFQSPVGSPVDGSSFLTDARALGWEPLRRGAHGDIVGIERRFVVTDVCAQLLFSTPLNDYGGQQSSVSAIVFSSAPNASLTNTAVHPVSFSEAHFDISRLTSKS